MPSPSQRPIKTPSHGPLPIPSWDDLLTLGYDAVADIACAHERVLEGPISSARDIAPLHVLRFCPGIDITPIDLYRAVQQSVKDGSATLPLIQDAKLRNPTTFSRRRRFNTGTDIFGRGEFIEQLYVLPAGRVRTFHLLSKDSAWLSKIASSQRFLCGLYDFAARRSAAEDPEVARVLGSMVCREPLEATGKSVVNMYLDGTELRTSLSRSSLDERVSTILQTTKIDLTLHSASQAYLQTPEGRRSSTSSRSWKNLWRGTSIFKSYDFRREVIEQIVLKADPSLSKQCKDAGLLSKDGKLKPNSMPLLLQNPYLKGTLSLLGISAVREDMGSTAFDGKIPLGFSMGDLNLGNVMVYPDGRQEFIDFEEAKLAPAHTLLFERWVKAGVYGPTGDPLPFNGTTTEECLLNQSHRYLQRIGEDAGDLTAFKQAFDSHKAFFLLRHARRYKQYESVDENPEKMRDLKRYFYSWFVREMKSQGRISGPGDARLQYLSTLFDAPLDDAEMERIFMMTKPAFCYRSELSPLNINVARGLHEDMDSRIRSYQKTRRSRLAAGLVVAGAVIGSLGNLGYQAREERLRNEAFERSFAAIERQLSDERLARRDTEAAKTRAIENIRGELNSARHQSREEVQKKLKAISLLEVELKDEKERHSDSYKVRAARDYYLGHFPQETLETINHNAVNAWVMRFWPDRQGYPRYVSERAKHPEWDGYIMTGIAAYLDWDTLKEGIAATHCLKWDHELGAWMNKRSIDSSGRMIGDRFRLSRYSNLVVNIGSVRNNSCDAFARSEDTYLTRRISEETSFFNDIHFGEGHREPLGASKP